VANHQPTAQPGLPGLCQPAGLLRPIITVLLQSLSPVGHQPVGNTQMPYDVVAPEDAQLMRGLSFSDPRILDGQGSL